MKQVLILFFCCLFGVANASHIVGGEMIYEYLGPGSAPNTSKYKITLKLFRDEHTTGAAMPLSVYIGIFSNDDNSQWPGPGSYFDVQRSNELGVLVNPFPSCITNPPDLDYHVGIYTITRDLPDNSKGYTATYQTCCRANPLENVYNVQGNGGTGATYSATIPPVTDNSPTFIASIDAICRNKPFKLDFHAEDPDDDSLVYEFAPAYNGGATVNSNNINPAPPPYGSVSYINNFSYFTPLGYYANIDKNTGVISGIAPGVGEYVVCVAVKSYKNGQLVTEHRKDFIINVTDCDFAGVQLDPKGTSCDGFNVSFRNDNNSPLNKTYYWSFGDPASGTEDTSTLPTPIHVYSDTGTYVYKLVVNKGEQCSDSATQTIKVYPGFFPKVNVTGQCVNTPIRFSDQTSTDYGFVDSWKWDFGDPSANGDTSRLKNTTYTYANSGTYSVQFTVTNSKGCLKTIQDTITIVDKPAFSLTNDTLICSIDSLQLTAVGNGTIDWTPGYNISDQQSFNPVVFPKTTTTYTATLTESPGCFSSKSVTVNVVDNVDLQMRADTAICQTDSAQLIISSNGLHYSWTPSISVLNDTAKNPVVYPASSTSFHVVASIGKCQASGDQLVNVYPYPDVQVSNDTAICLSAVVPLHASGGTIYSWSPPVFLSDPESADPISTPAQSIQYTVAVRNSTGCIKPSFATVLINVEEVVADAGPRDTIVVQNQPLQLHGSGAETLSWNPSTGLNDNTLADPIAVLQNNQQYVLTATSSAGCTDTDTIDVIVYKVDAGFYIPNAFTPNGDGLNDYFHPIAIGMKSITYFRIYDRRGLLIYSSKNTEIGWDGTYKGKPQDSQVYVWIAEGEDYQGKKISRKGVVTLIR